MRIAFIVGNFPALSETFILNQITGLIDRGHEVDIYAEHSRKDPSTHSDIEKYKLLDRTYYWGAPSNEFFRVVKAIGLLIPNFYKKSAVLPRILNLVGDKKYPASLKTYYQAIPFLDQTPYDIIHCHFGTIGNIGARLKSLGIVEGKLIAVFHGLDLSMVLKDRGKKCYRELFEVADLLLPISNTWQDKLIELGCNKDKISVHRMGIDLDKFTYRDRLPKQAETVKILMVARLIEKKGVEYGIRAVARAIQSYNNVEYNIIGDGALRDDLERLIQELGVGDRVKILGWKKQEDVVSLMESSDIFLAPSVTAKNGDSEGIPVVLMEAMAMGIPVLSTLHSGIPELIEDGKSGFLVPERDAETLAQKLLYLLENQQTWQTMGRNGRSFVEQNYNINNLNDRIVEIYQQLLLSNEVRNAL